ncbi:MAG: hypothetical protein J0L75_01885 [Spirochaetes bacterium]|nr:hypothetical protein [Spirochaetota bacterium]
MKTDLAEPLCRHCRLFSVEEGVPVCLAFPRGIPGRILFDGFDHRRPWAGDGGVQFQSIKSGTVARAS